MQGGNSNRGETANRFFAYPEISAKILGLPVNLLKQMWRLLQMLNKVSKHAKVEKYVELAEKVHSIYRTTVGKVKRMSGTVHKVIVHGADYIRYGGASGVAKCIQ